MYSYEKPNIDIGLRVGIAIGICFACFFLILIRLWYLQVLKGEHFRVLSENNRRKTIYVPPPRGLIMDRNRKIIVNNRPAFNIEFIPEDSPNPQETLKDLAELTGEDYAKLRRAVKTQKRRRRYEPKIVVKDVSRDLVAKVVANKYRLPGVLINHYPARHYLYGDFATHVIGYIREISKSQLNSPKYPGYRMGDLVGVYGIEEKLENLLQGQRGSQAVIVNAAGIRTENLSYEPEIAGRDVILTIDFDVQKAADKALEGKTGGVVAIDPNTGEVLAMASAPSFDPNIFTKEVPREVWSDLVAGKERRMNNRVVQGAYHPGSTFKAFLAIAGLAEGVISKGSKTTCIGHIVFGSRRYHCHKLSGHGSPALYRAIVQSCNVYFYVLGQRLGIDRIHDYVTRLGLGRSTNLGLVQENPGLVPSTQWKAKYYKGTEEERWWPGETLSVAIGQGYTIATPIQMALAYAAIVNGGNLFRPYVVKEVSTRDGKFKDDSFEPELVSKLDVKPWILEAVKAGLVGVVNDDRGTARRARLPKELDVLVGGKTGTSQTVRLSVSDEEEGRFAPHAWFVGFAPVDKPEIAVAALIENGGHGGVAAAPVVKEVIEAYIKKTREETVS